MVYTLTEQFNFLRTIISPFFEFKIKKERMLGGGFLGYSLYAWNEIETAQAYEQYTQAYEWYERAPRCV